MTTLPPGPGDTHKLRTVAEGFGADAARYDRARPSYPGELIEAIIAASPGRDILDVGAGTGILARLFQEKGCRVLGVEPDSRMAELARQQGLQAEVVTFEDWDPAGRTFDAVVAGQAWHWVDPVSGAAKAAEALRPGGRLALFWNVFGLGPEMREAFGEVHKRADTGLPFNPWARPLLDSYLQGCERAAAGIAEAGGFGEPEQRRFEWDRVYTREEWLDVVPTVGGMSRVPADKLAALLDGLGEVIDAAGGSFTMNYTTVAVTAARASLLARLVCPEPGKDLAGVRVRREDRVKDVLDHARADDHGEALEQPLPRGLERGQAQCVREPEIGVAEQRERQVKAKRGLGLVRRVLGGHSGDGRPDGRQVAGVIPEAARFGGAAAGAGDHVPVGGQRVLAGPARARVSVEDQPRRARCRDVDAERLPRRRRQRERRDRRPGQVTGGAVVRRGGQITRDGVRVMGHA
jgi:SAM-dependent methyltransferase